MDADTLEERKVIQMGKGPMGVAFPKDRTKVYVTNHDAGTVSVVDLNKMEVIDTFATSWKSISGPEMLVFFEETPPK
jgi:YVTN family beta-propeller protein